MSSVQAEADHAFGTVMVQLSVPHFFQKCAENGRVARSESEAAEMWSIGSKLHQIYAVENEKVAAAQVSTLTAHSRQLDELLAAAGLIAPVEKVASFEVAGRQASTRPDIAHSILTLQAAALVAAQQAN